MPPCARHKKEHDAYVKKMWAAPFFSKERAAYEKKANAALAKYRICKGKGAPATFDVDYLDYAFLWKTPPEKRPMSLWGAVEGATILGTGGVSAFVGASALLTAPYTTLLPIAMGARPSAPFLPMERRATIRGGLMVLKAAGVPGYANVDIAKLKSGIIAAPWADAALTRAAGGGSLKQAAERIRKVVIRNDLGRAAFAARALFIMSNAVGFDWYALVGLAIAGQGAAAAGIAQSRQVLNKVKDARVKRFADELKAGLAGRVKRSRRKERGRGAQAEAVAPVSESPVTSPPYWLFAAGGGAVLLLSLLTSRQEAA